MLLKQLDNWVRRAVDAAHVATHVEAEDRRCGLDRRQGQDRRREVRIGEVKDRRCEDRRSVPPEGKSIN